jgi:hypothetical protein
MLYFPLFASVYRGQETLAASRHFPSTEPLAIGNPIIAARVGMMSTVSIGWSVETGCMPLRQKIIGTLRS